MAGTAPVRLENITDSLQSFLGVQQAQTTFPQDIAADAIARLLETRADVGKLKRLWDTPDEWPALVDDWRGDIDKAAIIALRKVLDRSMVVQRFANGSPKTFLSLSPLFISHERANALYREMGRSVVDGLWGLEPMSEAKAAIKLRVADWGNHHPLALLLAPLCEARKIEAQKGPTHLAAAIQGDTRLADWINTTVTQDWRAWLKASKSMSVDEQLETMTSLIGLHLHVALLWRLGSAGQTNLKPAFFIDLVGDNSLCKHAANQCFGFWRERVRDALADVAVGAVQKLCSQHPDFDESLRTPSWTSASLLGWGAVGIESRGKATKAGAVFNEEVKRLLGEKAMEGIAPAQGEVMDLLRDALVTAFGGPSSPTEKTKVYLRATGQAAGAIGPREAPRKRYYLDEAGLSLLARLHVEREREVTTTEEELTSVEAFIDDIGARYGMIITLEREQLRSFFEELGDAGRPLRRHFPTEQAMSLNRLALERRLESMRLLRRYSDASAVIRIP